MALWEQPGPAGLTEDAAGKGGLVNWQPPKYVASSADSARQTRNASWMTVSSQAVSLQEASEAGVTVPRGWGL